jgi:cell division protein FtsI (penicillin-binding protein 3)
MPSRSRFSLRLFLVAGVYLVSALALVGRMSHLSIVQGPELERQAKKIICRDSVKMSYRGIIQDRNGASLATSMASSRVAVRRQEYVYDEAHADVLAPFLGLEVDELDRKLRDDERRWFWVSRSIPVDAASALGRLRIVGIDVHKNQYRYYPQGPLAAHIVGFTGIDSQGLEGIEKVWEEQLRGEAESVRVCKDVRGRVFFNESDLTGINQGATVELTLDATLQSIAESELKAQIRATEALGGSVVIMDPRTGEVLAMAVVPQFDPNAYNAFPVSHRRNRIVTDVFEPGSTTKPLLIASALDAGVVKPDDEFFCENGLTYIGGWPLRDHHPHGELTVAEILRVSSNICAAKIGAALGAESFHKYLTAFGFGRNTGVSAGLNSESGGLLKPSEKWRPIHVANISFGQGLSITAMQLTSSFATLANDGVRMHPYVVRQVAATDGTIIMRNEPRREARVVSTQVARTVTAMLEEVTKVGGTAPRAAVEGIRVAGKTGTAQKAEAGGYSKDRWLASFVGFLPADDPRLVIAVTVDEPKTSHFGGVVAAPVFRRVAEASLDYLYIPRMPVMPDPVMHVEPIVEAYRPPVVEDFDGTMPKLQGLSLRTAMRAMDGCECDVQIEGNGYVVGQKPEAGVQLARAASVTLQLAAGGVQ